MRTLRVAFPAALALAVVGCSTTSPDASTADPESTASPASPATLSPFEVGVRIDAGGAPINVTTGHAVPCAFDWNADGKKDLIVGQFNGGRIRLYLNSGTDVSPEFDEFTYLAAAGEEIKLPAG